MSFSRAGAVARSAIQRTFLVPVVRAWCTPYCCTGSEPLLALGGPVVFVANHASHLDTPAILAALPRRVRCRTGVAAAADYFYRDPVLGMAVTLGIGAFPFPRHGSLGLERAAARLAAGWNVLLFPEGTRSADGQLHTFRDGIGHLLLATDAPVVPVAVSGSYALWPRGQRLPRRGPLEVRFGTPWRAAHDLTPRQISTELAERVAALATTTQYGDCQACPR